MHPQRQTRIAVFALALAASGVLAGCHRRNAADIEADWRRRVATAQELLARYNGGPATLNDAASQVQRLLDENPERAEANVLAAQALLFGATVNDERFAGDNRARATALLAHAEALSASYCATYAVRAEMFNGANQPKDALVALAGAEAVHCQEPWLDFTRAEAQDLLGEWDDASARYQQLIDRAAGNASARDHNIHMRALFDLAKGQLRRGYIEPARATALRLATDAWPSDYWHSNNAVWLLRWAGDFDSAIQVAEIALKLTSFPTLRDNLGMSLYGKAVALEARDGAKSDASRERVAALWARGREMSPDTGAALKELALGAAGRDPAFRAVLLERGRELDPAFRIE